jgi:hypothetical protein
MADDLGTSPMSAGGMWGPAATPTWSGGSPAGSWKKPGSVDKRCRCTLCVSSPLGCGGRGVCGGRPAAGRHNTFSPGTSPPTWSGGSPEPALLDDDYQSAEDERSGNGELASEAGMGEAAFELEPYWKADEEARMDDDDHSVASDASFSWDLTADLVLDSDSADEGDGPVASPRASPKAHPTATLLVGKSYERATEAERRVERVPPTEQNAQLLQLLRGIGTMDKRYHVGIAGCLTDLDVSDPAVAEAATNLLCAMLCAAESFRTGYEFTHLILSRNPYTTLRITRE